MSLIDEALDPLGKFLRDLRQRGLEFTSGRYYSKYMGFVTDTDDPQNQGRVLVTCKVANGRDSKIDMWALPSAEFAGRDKGFYAPPSVGDAVWVWFDHGDRSQPRYSGAFWGNPGTTKTRDTSHVPAEFRTGAGQVTTRGFKTKTGHGWLFEDDTDKGKRFEAWTGEQTTAGAAATKHHRVVMTDKSGAEEVLITSYGEQKIRLIDVAGQESIEVTTKKGLFAKLFDYLQKIEVGGPLGYKLTIDEKTGQIELTTAAGNKVQLIEAGSIINVQDVTGNTVTLTPAGINLQSPLAVNITAAAAVNVTAGAAATIQATGAVSVSGTGLSLQSSGPVTQVAAGVSTGTFTGIKTETFLGGLFQTVAGIWQVSSAIVSILAPTISLGPPGTKYVLMDSRFVALFNAHTHPTTAPGVPTNPPATPAIIGQHTTSALAAN